MIYRLLRTIFRLSGVIFCWARTKFRWTKTIFCLWLNEMSQQREQRCPAISTIFRFELNIVQIITLVLGFCLAIEYVLTCSHASFFVIACLKSRLNDKIHYLACDLSLAVNERIYSLMKIHQKQLFLTRQIGPDTQGLIWSWATYSHGLCSELHAFNELHWV